MRSVVRSVGGGGPTIIRVMLFPSPYFLTSMGKGERGDFGSGRGEVFKVGEGEGREEKCDCGRENSVREKEEGVEGSVGDGRHSDTSFLACSMKPRRIYRELDVLLKIVLEDSLRQG